MGIGQVEVAEPGRRALPPVLHERLRELAEVKRVVSANAVDDAAIFVNRVGIRVLGADQSLPAVGPGMDEAAPRRVLPKEAIAVEELAEEPDVVPDLVQAREQVVLVQTAVPVSVESNGLYVRDYTVGVGVDPRQEARPGRAAEGNAGVGRTGEVQAVGEA